MPQLLLELFTEEIPARMQAKAQADLARALTDKLTEAGVMPEAVTALSGPRRLTAIAEGLPVKSADVREERKGPRVGAPEKAIQGFLRGAGLDSLDQAETREDKKGEIYVAVIEKPGRATTDIIAEIVPEIVRGFHWPKSMRWGTGDLRWVRPLQRILCTFDGEIVPFEIDGIPSGDETEGHRVMGRGPFKVRRFEDYEQVLKGEGHVILDREERKDIIAQDAKTLCQAQNLELVDDPGLLEEVAGLAEWPVVVMGEMDPDFLDLPPEVITLSMRTHQKYFAVRDPKTGGLAPKFIVVANLKAKDGGNKIAAGNAKVLSARLSDARFFWDNDRNEPLESRFDQLGNVVFHEKLGTIKDKAERVAALARELAPTVGADPDLAEKAARLAKCDLVTDMVFEFTELEGVMGRYYALEEAKTKGLAPSSPVIPDEAKRKSGTQKTPEPDAAGSRISAEALSGMTWVEGLKADQTAAIADAIRDHYKPKGPSDAIPTEPTAVAVALADRLDTLMSCFWLINETPTGSKDPFALRRAALGAIRLILENSVRIGLVQQAEALATLGFQRIPSALPHWQDMWHLTKDVEEDGRTFIEGTGLQSPEQTLAYDLLAFFADRLKVYLRDKGQRHDLIDAVFSLGEDDLVLIVKRVEALAAFLATDDGANLLALNKRASNILAKEEKKDGVAYSGTVQTELLSESPEHALHAALRTCETSAAGALKSEDFEAAMTALSKLRGPLDDFFENVTVNADDSDVRANRLALLSQIRSAMAQVADFSKIEG